MTMTGAAALSGAAACCGMPDDDPQASVRRRVLQRAVRSVRWSVTGIDHADQPLDVAQVGHLFVIAEGDGNAGRTGTCAVRPMR